VGWLDGERTDCGSDVGVEKAEVGEGGGGGGEEWVYVV
jgi:hypothetical protein